MNTLREDGVALVKLLAVVIIGLVTAGCATHKTDWAGRVGYYTYDQAVLELGPPDKQAKLQDGALVAEWLTRRGYATSYFAPAYCPYPYAGFYGPVFPGYVDTYSPDYFLRLSFDPAGKLTAWKKFSR